ncbi:hypothetical protein NIES21_13660 [Anabaenopsis circularis NIES-21]|uniref:DUF6875 domain-containing protein n=1 Tax=Anabaenopsis circularis NIES-21 TaxID=1085406 RepID=A0A1Z4GDJ2_9CYAN|nr:hypothetical protein NIES21_13660 [Anabaenopsis circularis NIES-21]
MVQLYTPNEIDQLQQDIPYLVETWNWLRSFLAKPHPELGRNGNVCPYMPKALNSNCIRLKVIRSQNLGRQEISDIVLSYRNAFLDLEPKNKEESIYKAIILIFPEIKNEEATILIDSIQKQLKPFFVESGLMLGEFHKRNETGGLHNPNFRPLRSPIPMLAIRFMVESDLPFLLSADDLYSQVRYLEAYLKQFRKKFKDENKFKTACQALDLAKKQIAKENNLIFYEINQ